MSDTASVRVLLAEDDPSARELLVELLTTLGHDVVAEVGTGREAIAQSLACAPDVVLLDVHMPDASGLEAAHAISAAQPSIAVVLFTGDETLTLSDREIAESHAFSLLPKPTPPKVLDGTIRLAVARAATLSQARREATDARTALEARKLIERAKGILMRRTGTSEQDAYRILQRSSQDRSQPMVAIAQAVLDSEPGLRG